MQSGHPISRRHTLMIAAGFFLLAANFNDPGLPSRLSRSMLTTSVFRHPLARDGVGINQVVESAFEPNSKQLVLSSPPNTAATY